MQSLIFLSVAKKKRIFWAESKKLPHFFEPAYCELIEGFRLRGNWYPSFFSRPSPIYLEVGCGKAEYTVFNARKYPLRNHVAVDIKGARMFIGARQCLQLGLTNAAFVRTQVQNLHKIFAPGEVNEIFIPFPDPQPNKPSERHRLTSPRFLDTYANILNPDHVIHLKTDNLSFFEYTLNVISNEGHRLLYATYDLYSSTDDNDIKQVQTFYEKQWLASGAKILYLRFQLKDVLLKPKE